MSGNALPFATGGVNTAFYVLGIAGGVLALVVSALGIRGDVFKTKTQGRIIGVLFLLVLLGALVALWTSPGEGEPEGEAAIKEKQPAATTPSGGGGGVKVPVSEVDFSIKLTGSEAPKAGEVTFQASNDGQVPHDLVIDGPGVADARTPVYQPSRSEDLTVTLEPGTYVLYCSVDGHRKLGMEKRITVS